jgi:hypothetical protein
MARLSHEVSAQLRFFAFFLSNSTLCLEVLGDIDYSEILHEPSALEMIFAIFANTLEINEEGKVLNSGHPEKRAAQYIRTWFDREYVVEPPFEPWETELYL